ncbi:YihY/virulence factor BrkB family protein [Eupransor demetentiae]|uniref:BrkB/YihY/UPF0761 family (Not an RNase) (BrkB) n=1 Tax=Eupransor demetentiae TaxID=3109584 RepID=A0ABM9N307_9LACO|nr:BrkB/YihY/UPF0761 family (not an RNase) (BrkB) [Lactobacillaceae bacterium LMG 33000]
MTYFNRAQLSVVGPAFAYYTLLTLFPTLIAATVLLSLFQVNGDSVMNNLMQILPASISQIMEPVIQSVFRADNKSYLSFSIIFIIWAISRVIAVLRRTFNEVSGVEERGSSMLTRAWSFLWLVMTLAAFVGLTIVGNVLNVVVHNLYLGPVVDFWARQTHWLIVAGLWLLLMMLNFMLPTREARTKLRYVALGSGFELLLLSGLNKVFAWYAKLQVGRYGFYQSISSIIVFLIWLNLIATILVVGYITINWLASFDKEIKEKADVYQE